MEERLREVIELIEEMQREAYNDFRADSEDGLADALYYSGKSNAFRAVVFMLKEYVLDGEVGCICE